MSGSWLRDFSRLFPFLHLRNKKIGFRDGQDNLQKGQIRRGGRAPQGVAGGGREWEHVELARRPVGEVGAGTGGPGAGTTHLQSCSPCSTQRCWTGGTGVWRRKLAMPCPYHAKNNMGVCSPRQHLS